MVQTRPPVDGYKICSYCNTNVDVIGCTNIVCRKLYSIDCNNNVQNMMKGSNPEITPRSYTKLLRLVGEKCLIKVTIEGCTHSVLWDTGAQVSLVGLDWLKEHLSNVKMHDISELINNDLTVKCANDISIPFVGWVDLNVVVRDQSVRVPFLVCKMHLENPIVGYNVISHFEGEDKVQAMLGDHNPKVAKAVSDIIERERGAPEVLGVVKVGKCGVTIGPNSVQNVKCTVRSNCLQGDRMALFEPTGSLLEKAKANETLVSIVRGTTSRVSVPVVNDSSSKVSLSHGQVIGHLTTVKSVVSLRYPSSEDGPKSQADHDCAGVELVGKSPDDKWDPEVSLDEGVLSPEQVRKVRQLLRDECESFSHSDDDIGDAPNLQLDIELQDKVPVQRTYSSVPPSLYKEVKDYVLDLVNRGWIRKSASPYSSPMVCVRKKDMSLRLCIDYRALNQKTVPTRRPIPRIQDSLNSLRGNEWFSTLDQGKAYHQGYVKPGCQPYTAFITPWGLYEWLRIPFGLMGAPGTFQEFMEETLADYRDEICIPYLDDVLVFNPTFDTHIDGVRKVLRRLREKGIKLKPRKCLLFRKEVRFLGQLVSKKGCRVDPEDIKAVVKLKDKRPSTVKEVRQLLGLLGYYRKYIPNFSKRAGCLYALLKEDESKKRKGDRGHRKGRSQPSKGNRVVWTESS